MSHLPFIRKTIVAGLLLVALLPAIALTAQAGWSYYHYYYLGYPTVSSPPNWLPATNLLSIVARDNDNYLPVRQELYPQFEATYGSDLYQYSALTSRAFRANSGDCNQNRISVSGVWYSDHSNSGFASYRNN